MRESTRLKTDSFFEGASTSAVINVGCKKSWKSEFSDVATNSHKRRLQRKITNQHSRNLLQRSAKVLVRGLVKFVPALA